MIKLPITDKELSIILDLLEKNKDKYRDLYSKLWSFRFQRNAKNGFS